MKTNQNRQNHRQEKEQKKKLKKSTETEAHMFSQHRYSINKSTKLGVIIYTQRT